MKTNPVFPRQTSAALDCPAQPEDASSSHSAQDRRTNGESDTLLEDERNFLHALLEHSSDGIYFKDKASRFLRCSRAKLQRHGLSDQEIVGKTDFDLFDETHARSAFNDEQEIIRTGVPVTNKVEHETTKNGTERWVLSAKWPLTNRQGEIIGTFGISKDITALKQAEARLEQTHKKLVDASRIAGMAEVATAVLHNVGNVLTSVNISTSLMSDRLRHSKSANLGKAVALLQEHAGNLAAFLTDDPRGRQLPAYLASLAQHLADEEEQFRAELASLCGNMEHIKEIIRTQQNYAKLSGVLEVLSITDLVEDALRLNAEACKRHGDIIVREYSPVPPLLIDKHKVLQILVNLISNAKYALDDSGRQDKRITVRVAPGEAGTVKISVIDNGVGVPPENLTRIFAHGFTTRQGGHGFGLHSGALAAKQLGGSLTCHSDGLGTGACFTLELPPPPSPSAN